MPLRCISTEILKWKKILRDPDNLEFKQNPTNQHELSFLQNFLARLS